MINIIYLALSFSMIVIGLEIGVKKGSPLIRTWNNWDYLAYGLLWGGVIFWSIFLARFIIWLFK